MVRATKTHDGPGFRLGRNTLATPQYIPPSDASMTFQLPLDTGFTTRLLDVDNHGLLEDLNDSFGTPKLPARIPQPPLTLEELTPRKKLKNNLRDALSTEIYAESTPFLKKEKFSPIRRPRAEDEDDDGGPSGSNHATAALEDIPDPPLPANPLSPERHPKKAHAAKPSIALPGIRTTNLRQKKACIRNLSLSSEDQQTAEKPEVLVGVHAVAETRAHNLPTSGEAVPNTRHQSKVRPELRHPPPATDVFSKKDIASCSHRPSTPPREPNGATPLILSELSSPKTLNNVTSPIAPSSPTRKSAKSASPVLHFLAEAPEMEQRNDFGGVDGALELVEQVQHTLTSPVPASAPETLPEPGPSAQRLTKRTVTKVRVKKTEPRRRSSIQRAYCVPASAVKRSAPTEKAAHARRRAGLLEKGRKKGGGSINSSQEKRTTTAHPPQLTKPAEFRFQIDARLEERKRLGDNSDSANVAKRRDPSIPDFKARHAAEEERSQARKTKIAPTVPQPLDFAVDARLQERDRFETERRAREMEQQRQRDEARAQKEREEEEELRRLRKETVVRANPVPDWYANAPKRNSRSTASSTSSRLASSSTSSGLS